MSGACIRSHTKVLSRRKQTEITSDCSTPGSAGFGWMHRRPVRTRNCAVCLLARLVQCACRHRTLVSIDKHNLGCASKTPRFCNALARTACTAGHIQLHRLHIAATPGHSARGAPRPCEACKLGCSLYMHQADTAAGSPHECPVIASLAVIIPRVSPSLCCPQTHAVFDSYRVCTNVVVTCNMVSCVRVTPLYIYS